MLEVMSYVVITVGILFGVWSFGRQSVSWLFVLLHTSAYSSQKGFYNLYDMADDEVSFKFYKDHNKDIEKYSDYLKIHADARSTAYKTFKHTYNALIRSIFFRILPIALTPAILFWSNWYFYLIGVFTAFISLVLYEIAKNGIRPGFYQRLVVFMILNTYSKTKAGQ